MKKLLRSPAVNAVCISLFSAFYAVVFFVTLKNTGLENNLYDKETAPFWPAWSGFLAAGHQRCIAAALIAVTVLIVVLLVLRRQAYDEYHISILTHCLVVAAVLTLVAIAVFYLMILNESAGIIEKFTLFIVIHWATVVFANLTYVLLCRWR